MCIFIMKLQKIKKRKNEGGISVKCRDCNRFKRDSRIEASNELSPSNKASKGVCEADDKTCSASDDCGCGAFSQKC